MQETESGISDRPEFKPNHDQDNNNSHDTGANSVSVATLQARLKKILEQIKYCANSQYNPSSTSPSSSDLSSLPGVALSSEHLALVVDGVVLTKVLGSKVLRELFLELACMCRYVLLRYRAVLAALPAGQFQSYKEHADSYLSY